MADPLHDIRALSAEAEALKADAVAIRRDIHAHPEVAFKETRTAGIVAENLRELGLAVETQVGQTGVVGVLRGAADGPTVMVRADMDALPMHELSDTAYASKTPGVMHACGHDGHTAIGLMVAKLLSARVDTLRGCVKFVFQPAEETLGGALAMIQDGVLDGPPVDCAFGLHLGASLPVGTVSTKSGALLASADTLDIEIKGSGGHAAMPHHAVDSIVVAAHVVTALQTVVSRNIDPLDTAVVSFGQIHGGSVANVIPETVRLSGTIRTFHADVRIEVVKRVRDIARGVAQSFGAEADVRVDAVCDATVNDPRATDIVRATAKELLGASAVLPTAGVMGSEDMSYFLNRVPGCFFFIGAELASGPTYPHHSPYFDFNEDAMPVGGAVMAGAVLRYLDGQA